MGPRVKNKPSVFVIAEVSSNHGQKFENAVKLIEAAKSAGADAVKFQVYSPDTMTINSASKYFKRLHPRWGDQTLYELYKQAYMPWEWMGKLKKIAADLGIIFFATAFDKTSVDFLESLKVPMYKIASFELVDLPLIEYIAKTGKPIIFSTGMATLKEIGEAVGVAKKAGAKDISLLKCVTDYPPKPEEMNLNTITDMKNEFDLPVGLSDHTLGTEVSVAAVALGASIIEKHITLSRRKKTPDNFFSIEPGELKELVSAIRTVEKSLGRVHYGCTRGEKSSREQLWRRSLFVVEDIKKGERFSEENVRSIRPAAGIKPKYFKQILNKKAKRNIKKGTPLKHDLIQK